jgi:hypothetical protein
MPQQDKSAQERLAEVEIALKEKELALREAQLQRELRALEMTEHEMNEFDNKKTNRQADMRQRDHDLSDQTKGRRALQARCHHKMGGRGREEMYSATGAMYCVAKYALPTSELVIKCTRCKKEWFPPLPLDYLKAGVNLSRNQFKSEQDFQTAIADNVDKGRWEAANKEYQEAANFDNGGMNVGSSWQTTFTYHDKKTGRDLRREKTHEYVKGAKDSAL